MSLTVIVDTNVFIDALCYGDDEARTVLANEHRGLYTFVMSKFMREELLLTITTHLVAAKLGEDLMNDVWRRLSRCLHRAYLFEPQNHVSISPDPPDNRFIECAIEYPTKYLVTSNTKDFQNAIKTPVLNRKRQPIQFLTPREFNLRVLQKRMAGNL